MLEQNHTGPENWEWLDLDIALLIEKSLHIPFTKLDKAVLGAACGSRVPWNPSDRLYFGASSTFC
jgi:hypothetical protein